MAIKPIDLQTNIAQIIEVARGEHARNAAVVEQQHILSKESQEKTNIQKEKVEENKKAERTIILNEEKQFKKGKQFKEGEKKEKQEQPEELEDTKIGRIIDVKK
ncbi:MAG: hypothetical protein WHV26_00065 [Spirochaetota bacterium]|jgi:sRNA-binding protein